jgi:hypothetical protein
MSHISCSSKDFPLMSLGSVKLSVNQQEILFLVAIIVFLFVFDNEMTSVIMLTVSDMLQLYSAVDISLLDRYRAYPYLLDSQGRFI